MISPDPKHENRPAYCSCPDGEYSFCLDGEIYSVWSDGVEDPCECDKHGDTND